MDGGGREGGVRRLLGTCALPVLIEYSAGNDRLSIEIYLQGLNCNVCAYCGLHYYR